MKPTIHFSQNFLRSPNLVKKLLEKTNITPQDVVYDIGAGKGVIADVLAFKAHTVIPALLKCDSFPRRYFNLRLATNSI
jgi:16S rRNA A1518/A1519 N6-dimethyltransferase RsmA/KsgA/DIM1 with predicted DNA glycosylase/AP lyase activity